LDLSRNLFLKAGEDGEGERMENSREGKLDREKVKIHPRKGKGVGECKGSQGCREDVQSGVTSEN